MSADNLLRIMKKENGKYQVRHEAASSLIHALEGVEPTLDELLLNIVADNVETEAEAMDRARDFQKEIEAEGGEVEYGIVGKEC